MVPELIFDQGVGDLFVLRIAGTIADDAVIASIEYAIEHLGTRLAIALRVSASQMLLTTGF